MPSAVHSQTHRASASVLVAVALISGAILLLGDRFGPAPGYALIQPIQVEGRVAACVADESMRVVDPGRERCRPDELELTSAESRPLPEAIGRWCRPDWPGGRLP